MDVEFVETTPIEGGRYTAVTGFAGPGFIANTSLMYVIRRAGFGLRAYLKTPLLPPMMLIVEGQPLHSFRIYGDKGLLMIVSEVLPTSENAWRIGGELFRWLMDKGVSEFIAVEGSLRPFREVVGYSTEGRRLQDAGVRMTREGAVTGINACLMEECLRRKIPWTSIFIPTSTVSSIDYGGVAEAVEILNRLFNLKVDTTPLRRMAEAVRRRAERGKGLRGLFRRGGA